MAPKKSAGASAPAPAKTVVVPPSTSAAKKTSSNSSNASVLDMPAMQIPVNIFNHYVEKTPQRTKLIDIFGLFLMVVGGLQLLYLILAGDYPYNAFLSGFAATVGQFVLTASLRIQTTEENKADFTAVTPERAFADYILGSVILHFFCINFIN